MTEDRPYYGDNLTAEQRSRTMRAIRSRDTAPERALRKALTKLGVTGYRIDVTSLPGRPDLSFGRRQLAVFVDGGYWHGRPDRLRPGRSEYWDTKIQRNVERDRKNETVLRERGWKVVRLWDDEIMKDPDAAATRIARRLRPLPLAEFFAGIGLVGLGLEQAGFDVAFANDIDPVKQSLYAANRDATRLVRGDIRHLHGSDIPEVGLATASFPCTDLSLAGQRNGLNGIHSSTFWEFIRILKEMGSHKPAALLIENVSGFISSANGADLAHAVVALNELGYYCDLLQMDAKHWVPQSRPRMFIVGFSAPLVAPQPWTESEIRPRAVCQFVARHPELKLQAAELPPLPTLRVGLKDVVEKLTLDDSRWWTAERKKAFEDSLSRSQRDRLERLRRNLTTTWRTAYRRTRNGSAVWEIRADEIAGCLRTARGGSSKQALIQAGDGESRIRWMTSREYAHLMGASNFEVSCVTENQALFGLGDAVCVPAIEWLGLNYLYPLADGSLTAERQADVAASV